ncbi:hypothetical protein WICMUC_001341 [Wickerhamomyces mucosus]|uniref:Uncharacterized protein n=1 Tax=Wickerhamomyces mucosus TaxID=1378264 RepID=A0A9P8PV43_9ASCO|nr:hypothetical protein WICMUC_001341 [Wickerhamomyces mucosus]
MVDKDNLPIYDSLFVIRHAQRCDKVAQTTSSINFGNNNTTNNNNNNNNDDYNFMLTDSYNPRLATFENTGNKSNNGYIQSMEIGSKILKYLQKINNSSNDDEIILNFHTSPYLRCLETIKFISDYLIKKYTFNKPLKFIIKIDQVLSEWLNIELDMNYYPPNDNGETLLTKAIQYLNSNLSFYNNSNNNNRNPNIKLQFDLNHDSYLHGNPGPFSESFQQQYQRLNNGLISLLSHDDYKSFPSNNNSSKNNILILVSHGACIRSLLSKIYGKPIYNEIPLASLSIVHPIKQNSKQSIWKLIETDIEISKNYNNGKEFNEIDLFKLDNPFKNFQTNHLFSSNNQLNFKNDSIKPLQSNNNDKLLFNNHDGNNDDIDSDTDSDDGLSFKVRIERRRPKSQSPSNVNNQDIIINNPKRFRSSSLFGPTLKNPFWNKDNKKDSNNDFKLARANSFLKKYYEIDSISPKDQDNRSIITNNQDKDSKVYQYRNIDQDDGNYNYGIPTNLTTTITQTIPDLEDQLYSSNNSSTNTLYESSIIPQQPSLLDNEDSISHTETEINQQQSSQPSDDNKIYSKSSNNSSVTIKPTPSQLLFDKSLIEKSFNELRLHENESKLSSSLNNDNDNYLSFNSNTYNNNNNNNKLPKNDFKIELYDEKKNRFNLNLYGDDNDNDNDNDNDEYDNQSGWFLGSNKY